MLVAITGLWLLFQNATMFDLFKIQQGQNHIDYVGSKL